MDTEAEDEVGPPLPPAALTTEDTEAEEEVGPPLPPGGGAGEREAAAASAQPGAVPRRKRKRTAQEDAARSAALQALPCAGMYERSLMHRDEVTHAAFAAATGFLVTASRDGHLKFWKVVPRAAPPAEGASSASAAAGSGTLEFVKHFRAHAGEIRGLCVSACGTRAATVGVDKSAKVFDVAAFDMVLMLRLGFVPGAAEFVFRRGDPVHRLAVADADEPAVHVFDTASGSPAPLHVFRAHRAPVRCMAFVPGANVVLSADARGALEYWLPGDGGAPGDAHGVEFRFKLDTDLFELCKAKAAPTALAVSPDGSRFAVLASDKRMRVFGFATGKLRLVLDESTDAAHALQRSGNPAVTLESIDFGRRMAVEKELDAAPDAAPPSVCFDETGQFLVYATYLGVKVVDLRANTLARIVGRVENTERFLGLALYQGVPKPDKRARLREAAEPGARPAVPSREPTLVCTAFKKNRFYMFTTQEPDENDEMGRDVFNERPAADELQPESALAARGGGAPGALALATPAAAIIHTTLGDIAVKLFVAECPKTTENWTSLAGDGYYDGIIFHRVIKGFMVQTGDPKGDGTGGTSKWGGEFEDEIRRELRHDRPFTLSMANAGPNTNGSQFFITCVSTPWLDGKHTVFGRVTRGADVVQMIEAVKVDRTDKPLEDVKIIGVTLQK